MPSRPLPFDELEAVVTQARPAFESLRNARIFITGGTGFFGHWLLESLLFADASLHLHLNATVLTRDTERFRSRSPHLANNPALTLLQGDVRSFRFPAEPHTHILHAAADSVIRSDAPLHELPESILDGTRRVLQFSRDSGAHRLLYVSSGAVYGRNVTGVTQIPETFAGGPDALAATSGYDEAKRMAEQLCVPHSHGTALQCNIARCFAFVGPHLPLDAHFAIGNFIRDAISATPIHIRGDGTPLRSYMYMSDLAAWLWTILACAPANRAYNVGSDVAISIGDLASLVRSTLRPELDVATAHEPIPGAPPQSYVPDISRARTELGLDVTVDLGTAIRRTAAWHGFVPAT